MSWTFDNSPYTLGARLVHLALADSANDDYGGLLWATQGTIAKKAGVSRATVNGVLGRMVADGWLAEANEAEVATIRAMMKDPRANVYRFLTCQISDRSDSETCQVDEADVSSSPARRVKSTGSRLLPTQVVTQGNASGSALATTFDGFDTFWMTYPRRTGKGAARAAWDKARRKATAEAIIMAAARFRDDPNREPQFTAHPATWLNQERWLDDPLPPRDGGRRGNPIRRDGTPGKSLLQLAADLAADTRSTG